MAVPDLKQSLDILVVEDNAALAANIGDHLETCGHRVDFAQDGEEGLALAFDRRFDVIVLDVALPRMDGLALCKKLRQGADRHVPVLMLTARDTLNDKLAGFEHGADDYLTKPFALAELSARLNALSQRHRIGKPHVMRIGQLAIDRQAHSASRNGVGLKLSPVLWQILEALAEAHPHPVSRSELTRRIWGDDPPESDALRSHIHLLRQVIDKPFKPAILETVHGVGFRLRGPGL